MSLPNQLLAIRVFARVAELSSFTRAADSLDMPKSTVSRLVQELEAHLSTRLLQRTTRRLVLTQEGRNYFQSAVPMIEQLEQLDTSFSQSRGERPSGRVRLDVSAAIARAVVIPRISQFHELYPDIQVELGVTDKSINLVSENVDCAIRGGHINAGEAVVRHLGHASRVTCASPGYLARFGEPTDPSDLEVGHRFVGWRSLPSHRYVPAYFERGEEQRVFDGPWAICVDESNAKVAAGVAGLGVIQSFTFAVASQLAEGSLVPILREWSPSPYPFQLLFPSNRHISPRVRALGDWLVHAFGDLV
jgi:DNA-binding transcriptional LysR family regulator